MALLEQIFSRDDQNVGSFGSFEKETSYVILGIVWIPVLLVPFIYQHWGRNIYRVTLFLTLILLSVGLILFFRFSWILSLRHRLMNLFTKDA